MVALTSDVMLKTNVMKMYCVVTLLLNSHHLSLVLSMLYCFLLSFRFQHNLIHRLFSLLLGNNPSCISTVSALFFLISSSLLHYYTTSSSSSHACHIQAFLSITLLLNLYPNSFLLTPYSLLARALCAVVAPFFLGFLLYGDIEVNPVPTSFTLSTLNIRSILNQLHSVVISDFIDFHSPDLFALLKLGLNPERHLLNLLTVLLLTTLSIFSQNIL